MSGRSSPRFATLGPDGTDHDLVTLSYPAFSHPDGAAATLIDDFSEGLATMAGGRAEIARPRTLALQPATSGYADISAWPEHVPASSIVRVAEGLLDGAWDSGLTAIELAEQNPGKFRIDAVIGTVDDPWLVYGRKRVAGAGLVAWPESPSSRLFRPSCG